MLLRGIAMLAVADQPPAAVLADEANGAAAIASVAQRTEAAAFLVTIRPPFRLDERGEPRQYTLTVPLQNP
jgi:hypothetical protein